MSEKKYKLISATTTFRFNNRLEEINTDGDWIPVGILSVTNMSGVEPVGGGRVDKLYMQTTWSQLFVQTEESNAKT